MSFARPDLLWLVALLPLVVAAGLYGYARRRRGVARRLGDPTLVSRLGLGDLERFPVRRFVLLVLAAAALATAAAGPQWGTRAVEGRARALNVIVAVDVSKSMLANDLEPSRLERTRLFARRLLRELPGDRIGLVAFAGRAYVLSPLTIDHGALRLYLDALDPEIISQGGSSLADALRQAADLARGEQERNTSGEYAVVLLSDGEALEEEAAVRNAADRAARLGVKVYTVGVGTPGGAPVPDVDSRTGEVVGYTRHPSTDEVVVSALDESLLRDVADRTDGQFVRLDEASAAERVRRALDRLDRAPGESGGTRIEPRPRFVWFIGAALLLLALDAGWTRRDEMVEAS